jgi:hypothetical protein
MRCRIAGHIELLTEFAPSQVSLYKHGILTEFRLPLRFLTPPC